MQDRSRLEGAPPDPTEDLRTEEDPDGEGFNLEERESITSVALEILAARPKDQNASPKLYVVGDTTLANAGQVLKATGLETLEGLSSLDFDVIRELGNAGAFDPNRAEPIPAAKVFRAVGAEVPHGVLPRALPYICDEVMKQLGVAERVRMAAVRAMTPHIDPRSLLKPVPLAALGIEMGGGEEDGET